MRSTRALVFSASACLSLALAFLAPTAAAQEERSARSVLASPGLPAGHWALEAARRAEALGLTEAVLPPFSPVPRALVRMALRQARQAADREHPALQPLVDGWNQRFEEEFPGSDTPSAEHAWLAGSSAGLGLFAQQGEAEPGTGEAPFQTGARRRPDEVDGGLSLDLSARPIARVGLRVRPVVLAREVGVREWEISLAAGPARISAARTPAAFGLGEGGQVVLSGAEPLTRVEIGVPQPRRLPGWLGHAGPITFTTFLGRLSEERHPGSPWLWGASGSARPHPRVLLAIHRAAMIGGAATDRPVTAAVLLKTLIGIHAGAENQVVSGELRVRLPTERTLPLEAYCEWGAEDNAGALRDVPGFVCGGEIAAVPAVPSLSLGLERAYFAARCCGNPPWYRHSQFPGGWSGSERPLGHPLGGQGSEWLGYVRATPAHARLRLEARGFLRDRGAENLFVPGRGGRSHGGSATLLWRIARRGDLLLDARGERGEGWSARRLEIGGSTYFGR